MGAYIFVSVLIFIVCILLVLVVLVQNSKGGGLASNFSSSNQYMGARKTADFLEKTTWTLAVALLVLCLFTIFVIPRGGEQDNIDTQLRENMENSQSMPNYDYAPPPEQ